MTDKYTPTPAFDTAVKNVDNATGHREDSIKLLTYSLYKQTKEGDVTGSRPGFFDPKGGVKFDAWTVTKGMAREEADARYINCSEHVAKGKPLSGENLSLLKDIKEATKT